MTDILIIDDHVIFREGLVSLLVKQPDFKVVGEAGSVHEAIRKARELKPDLILMDFNLPDGTGLDATRMILTERPETMIVFLTISDDDERVFEAIRNGAKGYLLKDLSVTDLLASLRSLQKGELALTRKMASQVLGRFVSSQTDQFTPGEGAGALTPRELEVLHELAFGATNQEIALCLVISVNTVKNHIQSILKKLGLKNRREAAAYASRLRL
jgi:DNA-binding NarL/FixJ family response regulator